MKILTTIILSIFVLASNVQASKASDVIFGLAGLGILHHVITKPVRTVYVESTPATVYVEKHYYGRDDYISNKRHYRKHKRLRRMRNYHRRYNSCNKPMYQEVTHYRSRHYR